MVLNFTRNEIDVYLGRTDRRVVHSYGIEFENLFYNNDELAVVRRLMSPYDRGRKALPSDVVDSATAAKDLGASIQELGRLTRSGVLTEHPNSHRRSNRRYFYRQQVTDVISRYSGNPALIPIDVVADRLGRSVRSLYSKEVRAGRLTVTRSPLGRAYLHRNEVGDTFEDLRERPSASTR